MLSRVCEKWNRISLIFGTRQRRPTTMPPTVLLTLDRRPLPTKGPNVMHEADGWQMAWLVQLESKIMCQGVSLLGDHEAVATFFFTFGNQGVSL